MKIAIVGSGYVGLVTGACFAEVGHQVICIDNDKQKVEVLQSGDIPIYEPGLERLVRRNVTANRLSFSNSIKLGVENSEVIFIAVPTPPQVDGSVDLTYVERVAREIAEVLEEYRVIVDKSTVPIKTGEEVARTIRRYNQTGTEFDVVSNPEFLREGCAVADLMKPDRIVIGTNSNRALAIMKRLYEPFNAPIMVTEVNSAELIKHAANSFLALKISYINAIAAICEASGADVEQVAEGIGADKRIGRSFLDAGLGYGGSCFPKDVAAFISISEQIGEPLTLLQEVQHINARQRERFLKRLRNVLWVLKEKRIAVWGLTFKPNTDDVRSSVAVDLVNDLIREGAYVTAYDPRGNTKVKELDLCPGVHLAGSALEAAQEAEALVVATEWPDFAVVDMKEVLRVMHTPIVFDGRNLFNPMIMRGLGFQYSSIGRPSAELIVDELPNRLRLRKATARQVVKRRDHSESTAKKALAISHKA
jgi:UDPglucose 6-dehydrogenase